MSCTRWSIAKPIHTTVRADVWSDDADAGASGWTDLERLIVHSRRGTANDDDLVYVLEVTTDSPLCACGNGQQYVEIGQLIVLAWQHQTIDAVLAAFKPRYGRGQWTLVSLALCARLLPPAVVAELRTPEWLYALNQLLRALVDKMRARETLLDAPFDSRDEDGIERAHGIDCYKEGTVMTLLDAHGLLDHGSSIGWCWMKKEYLPDNMTPEFV